MVTRLGGQSTWFLQVQDNMQSVTALSMSIAMTTAQVTFHAVAKILSTGIKKLLRRTAKTLRNYKKFL